MYLFFNGRQVHSHDVDALTIDGKWKMKNAVQRNDRKIIKTFNIFEIFIRHGV